MSPICSHKRDLRTSADLTRDDIEAILKLSQELKDALQRGMTRPFLAGNALAMIFEKPSLRTRCTFEIGMVQLGGHAIYLAPQEIGLGRRESIHDVAHNLERWFDMVVARTFAQKTVDELALHCRVPVINALSDLEHPCQALADLLTLTEKVGDLKGFTLAYIGDGNNICHSLMLLGVKMGMNIIVSSPEGYEPLKGIVEETIEAVRTYGGTYRFERDPRAAVAGAQAIYTDVWASMGQEDEAEARAKIFEPYQVNEALVGAAPAGAFVMHDLPAHRGEEITSGVLDSPSSIVFDQAENRLHAQKGVMVFLDNACR
jgi:ornithine carbamoyltransferase